MVPILSVPILTKRNREYLSPLTEAIGRELTLFSDFNPNPGGQSELFDLYPFKEYKTTQYRWLYARGGIGAGKSFAGAAFGCGNAYHHPDARGLISANSYEQLSTSTVVALAEFCKAFGVPLKSRQGEDMLTKHNGDCDLVAYYLAHAHFCYIFDAPVLLKSAESFTARSESSQEIGRGLQARWAWCDEFSYAKESAFTTLDGRLGRGPGTMQGVGLITSSINKNNPYNWCYDRFDAPDRSPERVQMYKSVRMQTDENIHQDETYYLALKTSYDPELFAIEVESEYRIVSTGRIFRHFDRVRNGMTGAEAIDFGYDPTLAAHISFDFNWNPATASVFQIIDESRSPEKREAIAVHEFYLENSDTYELIQAVCEWLQQVGRSGKVHVYGDASGNQHRAESKKTNWDIVFEGFRKHKIPKTSHVPTRNPDVMDTINIVNSLFFHARLYINIDRCPEMVKDIESARFDKKGGIDKKDPKRSHLIDSLRYFANSALPSPIKGRTNKKRGGVVVIPGIR